MLKYVAGLALSTLFATPADSQSRTTPAIVVQVQKLYAQHEILSAAQSGDPHYRIDQARIEQVMIAHVIAERQAQLMIDTEKLVALTAQLKEHVDKAGTNILSIDVIKKAQEIQKLAKTVQDKMRNAY